LKPLWKILLLAAVALVPLCADSLGAERFPPPDFETGYEMPSTNFPASQARREAVAGLVVMAAAMSLAAWFALGLRSRRAMLGLCIFSLVYFGFVRGGCLCPIGAIQHVALALADRSFELPLTAALLFALPLAFALLFGRVFCAAVCPLGAIQDVALVRPVALPRWLTRALGIVPLVYLGLAVLYAATSTGFIICRYDPFVPLFRLSGPVHMLVAGGVLVALSTFIGRPYCRFLCPYGVLLGFTSRWAKHRISTTPDECIVCGMCENACPFGAIVPPTPEGAEEE
jgi:ferredoxin